MKSTDKFHFLKWIICFAVLNCQPILSQNEGNVWYFGSNAGLDFSTAPPTVLNDGQLNTLEGTASLADENGNLLFYTNGERVYTKNHTLMPNGDDEMGGNYSSAQSAIIVPHPANSNQFFLFTVSQYVHSNLYYSIIDMNLNDGLGDVVEEAKALPVLNDTGEYIQSTASADGSFWWILTRKNGTADYYAYKVTEDGIDVNNPVISTSGLVSSHLGDIGFIKFNNLGNRLVKTSYIQNHFEVSDFNNATGEVSNSLLIPFSRAYGAEFSPNNRFLYISGYSNQGLKQYDLDSGNTAAAIQASAFTYNTLVYGAIQIAPDGKIYCSRYDAVALDVIHSPNQQGVSANFVLNSQSLGQASAQLGLPNIITNLVSQTPPVLNSLTVLDYTDTTATLSVLVDSDGGSEIIERGFYFGTDTLTIENEIMVAGTTGQMIFELENLQPETTYYFGAFATNHHGTRHINWETFDTLSEIDTTSPVAICNELVVVDLDEFGYAYITVEMIDNGSYDNDGIAEINIDKTVFYCNDLGENQVTLTVVDHAGNTSSCTTIVYVQDTLAPKIQIELETEYFYFISENEFVLPDFYMEGKAWTYDNCTENVSQLGQEPAPGIQLEAGMHTIVLSARDDAGNTASVSFEIFIESVLSVHDFTDTMAIQLFPNPTTDYFYINNKNNSQLQMVQIFDVSGKLLSEIKIDETQNMQKVDVSHLATATYFVAIKINNTTSFKRLVKR